jgi:acyl-CoA thioester hydrolase
VVSEANARRRPERGSFPVFRTMSTRWHDNDVYGHVNNVVYYGWFDTAVNAWLIENGLLDVVGSPVIAVVAESGCTYFESLAFPEAVEIGLGVERLGRSSVTYRLGAFASGALLAAASCRFTHVHVDRIARTPVAIPAEARMAMEKLLG